MTLVVTHNFTSTTTETSGSGTGGGQGIVGPGEWNANHTLTGLVSPAQGGTGITSGTGITFFSSATVIADSGTLTNNVLIVGGGSNGAPTSITSGTTSQVLHGNASGAPSFGAVNLGSEVAGTLSTANLSAATTAAFGIVKPDNSTVTISSGVLSATAGTALTAGPTGAVQFASAGSTLSGDGSFTYAGAGAGVSIKLTSSTSTGLAGLSIATSSSSQMQSDAAAIKITALWNNSGTVYDAPLFMNLTNTNSAANSRIFDIMDVGTGTSILRLQNTASAGVPGGNGTIQLLFGSQDGSNDAFVAGYDTVGTPALLLGASQINAFAAAGSVSGPGSTAVIPALIARTNAAIGWNGIGFASGLTLDTALTRVSSGVMQHGTADSSAPVPQGVQAQSVSSSTAYTNQNGQNWTFIGSKGTGSGTGGNIIFQVAPAGASGSAQNSVATALTVNQDKSVTFAAGALFTAFNVGTISTTTSTFTPAVANGNYQFYTNGGAHGFGTPATDCAIDVLVSNSSAAGVITFSGSYNVSANVGDSLTTSSGANFIISVRRINAISTYTIKALQ